MRIGKIARLPKSIREQLNQRLANHELGDPLLTWLNNLPEVRQMLAAQFDGFPISKQNLSRWRQEGFREWQTRQDALDALPDIISEAGELQPSAAEPLADKLAPWVTAHYFVAARSMLNDPGSPNKFKFLRTLCGDLNRLRRSDHRSAALKLKEDRQAFCRERTEKKSAVAPATHPNPAPAAAPLMASSHTQSRPVTPSQKKILQKKNDPAPNPHSSHVSPASHPSHPSQSCHGPPPAPARRQNDTKIYQCAC
jgi:hypothetical protein